MPKMNAVQKKRQGSDDGVQKINLQGLVYALVPWSEYERMNSVADDDSSLIAAADAARGDESFPANVARRLAAGEPPLKVIREWRGLSQSDLHEVSGVSAQYISQLERRDGGRNVGRKVAGKLAQALKVSPEMLMDV